jgi:uncharacterized protein (TIGR03067 family)
MRVLNGVLLVSAVGLIAADAPKKGGGEAFQGTWSVVSMAMRGQAAPEALVKSLQCRFDEKTYTNTVAQEVVEEGSYTIDSSKTPKTIDFDIKKGHDQGKRQLGIYKIEGNKLTLVLTQPGSTVRPASFKAGPEDPVLEVVLERVKKP